MAAGPTILVLFTPTQEPTEVYFRDSRRIYALKYVKTNYRFTLLPYG